MDRTPVRVPNPLNWCCHCPLNSQKRPVGLAAVWRAAKNTSGQLEDKVTLRPCCAVLWPIPMWGTKNTASDILSAPPRPCASLGSFLLLCCFAFLSPPPLFNAATLKGPTFLNSPENWLNFFHISFNLFQPWRRESFCFPLSGKWNKSLLDFTKERMLIWKKWFHFLFTFTFGTT